MPKPRKAARLADSQAVPPAAQKTWWLGVSATPWIGLVMLFVGVVCGFLARPLLKADPTTAASTLNQPVAATQPIPASSVGGDSGIDPNSPASVMMQGLIDQTRHFRGSPDAPVTIIVFSDFQCTYCGQFATDVEKRLENEYVWTGQIRVGYWQMAFLGDESQWAAEASECADEQGAFWKYHDYLFSHQNGENLGAFSKDNLKQYAIELGLNSDKFNECLDSGRYTEIIQEQNRTALDLGVETTPSFMINGQPVVGIQTYDYFKQIIDGLLTGN